MLPQSSFHIGLAETFSQIRIRRPIESQGLVHVPCLAPAPGRRVVVIYVVQIELFQWRCCHRFTGRIERLRVVTGTVQAGQWAVCFSRRKNGRWRVRFVSRG